VKGPKGNKSLLIYSKYVTGTILFISTRILEQGTFENAMLTIINRSLQNVKMI